MLRFNHSFPADLVFYFHSSSSRARFDSGNYSGSSIIMGSQDEKCGMGTSKGFEGEGDGEVFRGWMAHGRGTPLRYTGFRPKEWEETDVDIAVECCGVCASDLHVLRSGWVMASSSSLFLFLFFIPENPPMPCRVIGTDELASRAKRFTPAASGTKSSARPSVSGRTLVRG